MLLPIIVNDLTIVFVNIVDSIMVSSAGEAAVSGISLVGALYNLFTVFFNTLAIGCTVVVAQYIGSGCIEKASSISRQSLFISLIFAIPVSAIVFATTPSLLQLIYPDTEPAVMESAKVYLWIIALSLPATAAQDMMLGSVRAMGKNSYILLLGLAQNVLNIAGNALLIYGLKMGVTGAAIATTLSAYICCFISFIITRNQNLPVNIRGLRKTKLISEDIKRILTVGLSSSTEQTLQHVGKLFVSAMYSNLNATAISAFFVSRNIINIGWTLFCGFGTVLTTVVGQCVGANEPEQARYYTKKAYYITVPLCLLLYGIIFLFRDSIVQVYDLSGETLSLAAQYTGLGALLTGLCLYPLALLPPFSFRAAGDITYTAVSCTVITFLCQVGLCFVFVKCYNWGITGVWLSIGIDWIARVILHSIRFHGDRWLNKRVI